MEAWSNVIKQIGQHINLQTGRINYEKNHKKDHQVDDIWSDSFWRMAG